MPPTIPPVSPRRQVQRGNRATNQGTRTKSRRAAEISNLGTGAYVLPIHLTPVIPERGSWRSPPRSHVGEHTVTRAVPVRPHFLASISHCRVLILEFKN